MERYYNEVLKEMQRKSLEEIQEKQKERTPKVAEKRGRT